LNLTKAVLTVFLKIFQELVEVGWKIELTVVYGQHPGISLRQTMAEASGPTAIEKQNCLEILLDRLQARPEELEIKIKTVQRSRHNVILVGDVPERMRNKTDLERCRHDSTVSKEPPLII
jgi:hypothetical protein